MTFFQGYRSNARSGTLTWADQDSKIKGLNLEQSIYRIEQKGTVLTTRLFITKHTIDTRYRYTFLKCASLLYSRIGNELRELEDILKSSGKNLMKQI